MADFWLMADVKMKRSIPGISPTAINWRSAGGDVRRARRMALEELKSALVR